MALYSDGYPHVATSAFQSLAYLTAGRAPAMSVLHTFAHIKTGV